MGKIMGVESSPLGAFDPLTWGPWGSLDKSGVLGLARSPIKAVNHGERV
jgi:hypothetical protein